MGNTVDVEEEPAEEVHNIAPLSDAVRFVHLVSLFTVDRVPLKEDSFSFSVLSCLLFVCIPSMLFLLSCMLAKRSVQMEFNKT